MKSTDVVIDREEFVLLLDKFIERENKLLEKALKYHNVNNANIFQHGKDLFEELKDMVVNFKVREK
ncbi:MULTISPECIES: hypothetical protein [Bacillus]|uniref:hypothetical protein n=1 Tax=Bacillus TaxID=1386 RepID=UPI0011A4F27F|nr:MULTISPECIES: hypothetical protein [Bacillus]UXO88845.1 hypothetical protein N7921_03840 [Bacillus safensis]